VREPSYADRQGVTIGAVAGMSISVRRRMMRRVLSVAAAGLAAACGAITPPPDTPRVPAAALGTNGDVDEAAASIAAWDFADPSHTNGDPASAARGVIALEYMAGQMSSSPRYAAASPLVQQQMLDARQELRAVLGIAAGTPSQEVVDAMIAVENASLAGDVPGESRALSGPAFTLGADATRQRLLALPQLPITNVATEHAQFETDLGRGNF